MNAYNLSQSIPRIQQIFGKYEKQLEAKHDWTVEGFVDADPTENKIYLDWIVNSFILDGIKRFEDVESRVRPALEDFLFLQDRLDIGEPGKPWTNERDINNYCGLVGCKKKKFQQGGLEPLLNKYSDVLQARQSKIEKTRQIHDDTDVLLDNDEVTVYVPKTQEASCYYGQGTKWCTAATRAENRFDEYNSKGPLYIIIGKDGEKYQMHIEELQLMDAEDKEYRISDLVATYPSLESFKPIRQFEFENAVLEEDIPTIEKLVRSVDLSYNDYSALYNATVNYNKNMVKIIMENIDYQPPLWFNSDYLLDRSDGPAVEKANGNKWWYRDGKLHRLDGPAVEMANGDKEWYRNGERHREDGPAIIWSNGVKMWFRNGKLHREDGPAIEKPAIENANGEKKWYRNGQRHREDGPAIEKANGDKFWYWDDKLHRLDGPAVEYANGDKEWYKNGELHRKNGPAIEKANGDQMWYKHGKLHRKDGPAIEKANGDKEWYKNGELHRKDGPAIESANGDKEWYKKGRSVVPK